MTRRVLILLRHGKAESPLGVSDHDRNLTERGRREAALAGDWLRATQPPADQVLCSTSTRTRQTLAATGIVAPTNYEPLIFRGSAEQMIELVSIVDDVASTILLIGHLPELPWVAWQLASNHESDAALQMRAGFPTSTMAVLEFDHPWSQVGTGTGDLIAVHVPR